MGTAEKYFGPFHVMPPEIVPAPPEVPGDFRVLQYAKTFPPTNGLATLAAGVFVYVAGPKLVHVSVSLQRCPPNEIQF